MLNRLRVTTTKVIHVPPQPARIKPNININDFRRFTPKTIGNPPPRSTHALPKINAPVRQSPPPPLMPQRTQPPAPPQHLKTPLPKVIQAAPRLNVRPPRSPQPSGRPFKPPTVIKTSHPPSQQSAHNANTALRGVGRGRVLIMIAAGPSVNEVDFAPLKSNPSIDFMCINQPNQSVWPTRYWAFCDHTQYRRNKDIFDSYNGVIINSTNVKARKNNQFVLGNRSGKGKGFALDISNGYFIGRSSTYANMQVAYYMDYERIYIFGVDMTDVNGMMHYYGQNPDVSNEKRKERFAAEAEHYLWAGRNVTEEVRNRFTFCSSYNPWPFLQYFQRMDHREAVAKIGEYLSSIQK